MAFCARRLSLSISGYRGISWYHDVMSEVANETSITRIFRTEESRGDEAAWSAKQNTRWQC